MKTFVKLVLISSLVVLASGFSSAYAESDIGFKGIAGRLGYVDIDNWDGTFNIGVAADLGTWMENLKWDASIEYWSSSESAYGFDLSISDIALRSGVLYEFMQDKFRPRAGGGLAFHMISWEWAVPTWGTTGWSTADDSETKFGFYLQGGVETDLSDKLKGAADLRLDMVEDADQTHIM
ncbi:porin family protein, partial [bacterium]|nr:porin family protein [bacterium]